MTKYTVMSETISGGTSPLVFEADLFRVDFGCLMLIRGNDPFAALAPGQWVSIVESKAEGQAS